MARTPKLRDLLAHGVSAVRGKRRRQRLNRRKRPLLLETLERRDLLSDTPSITASFVGAVEASIAENAAGNEHAVDEVELTVQVSGLPVDASEPIVKVEWLEEPSSGYPQHFRWIIGPFDTGEPSRASVRLTSDPPDPDSDDSSPAAHTKSASFGVQPIDDSYPNANRTIVVGLDITVANVLPVVTVTTVSGDSAFVGEKVEFQVAFTDPGDDEPGPIHEGAVDSVVREVSDA